MKGKLYLVPIPLGDCSSELVIPYDVSRIISNLSHFIVENTRTARRYIRTMDAQKNIDKITFLVLNKHTQAKDMESFLEPAKEGYNMGIISEAGVPAIADPGADLVALAHESGIEVVPLVGPSSILLSLMASGLNGQSFTFHGYLPIKGNERIQKLKTIEKESHKENKTQIFMETPYRNNKMFADILKTCRKNTRLCVASNITLNDEYIKTKTVEKWQSEEINLHKKPTVFLLLAS
jgi:16S rRNA (cytidine1402-2'-O)-methyltransferase